MQLNGGRAVFQTSTARGLMCVQFWLIAALQSCAVRARSAGADAHELRPATMEEILELVSPEQLSADGTGYNCTSPHKHVCVGHARTYYGRPPPYDAKNIASLVPVSYRPNGGALDGLRAIITRVLESDLAQPELIFAGDSLLSDNWAATVAGIQRLGHTLEDMDEFLRSGVCYAAAESSDTPYLQSEAVKCNFSVKGRAVEDRGKGLARFESFGVRYLRRPWELVQDRKAQFANAEVIIVNCGVIANSPSAYTTMLAQVRTFLLQLQKFTNATVLWQETLPQHFDCGSAAGLYSHTCSGKKCGPIMDKNSSNWRNHHFDKWLQQEPAIKRQLHIVPAFDSFFDRHDLHLQGSGDCTHFLYSPFQWQHVWDSAAKTLELINNDAKHRSKPRNPTTVLRGVSGLATYPAGFYGPQLGRVSS